MIMIVERLVGSRVPHRDSFNDYIKTNRDTMGFKWLCTMFVQKSFQRLLGVD